MNDQEIRERIEFYKQFAGKLNLTTPLSFNIEQSTVSTPEEIGNFWRLYLEKKQNPFLSLYVHIPFCFKKKCNYCMYDTITAAQDSGRLDRYLDYLSEAIAFYAPVFRGNRFTTLYIGGGTPSLLGAVQLERLFGELFGYFNFNEEGYRTIEIKPTNYTKETLDQAASRGFNRISIGVQSLSKPVLEKANREYAEPRVLQELVSYAKKLKFQEINMDIMAGLPADDLGGFESTFRQIVEIGPTTVSIYFFRPENVHNYSTDDTATIYELYKEDYASRVLEAIAPAAEKHGYFNAIRNPNYNRQLFIRNDHKQNRIPHPTEWSVRMQNSLLGIGLGARSFIQGHVTFTDLGPNKSKNLESPEDTFAATSFYTTVCDDLEKMRQFVRNSLHLDRMVKYEDFRMNFNRELSGVFSDEIKSLEIVGKLRILDDKIELTTSDMMDECIHLLFFYDQEKIADIWKKDSYKYIPS